MLQLAWYQAHRQTHTHIHDYCNPRACTKGVAMTYAAFLELFQAASARARSKSLGSTSAFEVDGSSSTETEDQTLGVKTILNNIWTSKLVQLGPKFTNKIAENRALTVTGFSMGRIYFYTLITDCTLNYGAKKYLLYGYPTLP